MEIEALKCVSCGSNYIELNGATAKCESCGTLYMVKSGKLNEEPVIFRSSKAGRVFKSCYKNLKLKIAYNTYCVFENNTFVTDVNEIAGVLDDRLRYYYQMKYELRQVMDEDSFDKWQRDEYLRKKQKNESKNLKIKI